MGKSNTMRYLFTTQEGKVIETEKEVWGWEAYYNDLTVLKQFDDYGIFHQFREIDQSKLTFFKMVADGKPPLTLMFDPLKMKLIHYYKRFRLNIGTEDEKFFTIFCFGYEIIGGSKVIMAIVPSGEIILCENPDIINFH